MTHRGCWALVSLLALFALSLLVLTAGVAADPGGPSFTTEMLDAEGHPESLAGAHPDLLRIGFDLGKESESLRDLEIELPPGLGGSGDAVPQCPRSVYESEVECPPESQVGRIEADVPGGGPLELPLFEIEPLPGEVLALGSRPSLSLPLKSQIRPSDFGVMLAIHDLQQGTINAAEFELWGVPADHQEGTSIPRRPFLTAPTECGPVTFQFRIRTWAEGAQWTSASSDAGSSLTGCEGLAFKPKLGFELSEPAADSPTGVSLDLNMPGEAEGSERAPANAKSVEVRFPAGLGISPGGVQGLSVCTDEQLGLGDDAPARCPASSKIGSAEIVSSALGRPLVGEIYIAEGRPGERLRSFLVVPGPGFTLKLVSAMQIDPGTGRISTVMSGLPAAPIQHIRLGFDGGQRALFASPLSCGRTSASATFVPYGGGATVDSTAQITISAASSGASCAPPSFSPQLLVTSSSTRAGAHTSIATLVRRRPGEQLLRSFSSTLPSGIAARLGTVTPCPPAAVSLDDCPSESRIGTASAAVGSGVSPALIRGDVYLTGPYRGAPFATLTSFDGRVGPLDLGTITSRSTLEPNPYNGRLIASTSAIPTQVEGLPIRFQSMGLNLDRPGFLRNPTSCAPGDAVASFESQDGVLANATSSFALRGCHRLRFEPRIRIALLGPSQLRKGGAPSLRTTVRLPAGDSNLRALRLVFPAAIKLGTGDLKELCSHADALRGACPSGSRVGFAMVHTPLVDERLRGGMYMVQPDGEGLPDMWTLLAGAGLSTRFRASSDQDHGRYVSVLSGMPDTPMSSFSMRFGGDSRSVSLREDPCGGTGHRLFALVYARSQDGRRRTLRTPIVVKGCPLGDR